MPYTAAIISAVGSIAGGALSSKKPKDKSAANVPITTNPLYQQLLLNSLLGLGAPINPATLRNSSPLGTLISFASTAGLKKKEQIGFGAILDNLYEIIGVGAKQGWSTAQIADKIGHYLKTSRDYQTEKGIRSITDPAGLLGGLGKASLGYKQRLRGKRALTALTAAAGYTSLEELIQSQIDFEKQMEERQTSQNEQAKATQKGRLDALNKISELQSGFVAPTEEQIKAQAKTIEDAFKGQVSRERADQELALLTQASQLGINPGGRLARLDEWQAQKNLEAQPEALSRALQLLSGEQGLQSTALTSLQSSLGAQDSTALSLLGLQNANQLGLGQIAAQQAMQLSQQQQAANLSLANGINGAFNALGQGILLKNQPSTFNYNGLIGGQAYRPFTFTQGPQNPNDF
jgi:hypothetical protein